MGCVVSLTLRRSKPRRCRLESDMLGEEHPTSRQVGRSPSDFAVFYFRSIKSNKLIAERDVKFFSDTAVSNMEEAAKVAVQNGNKDQLLQLIDRCGEGFVLNPSVRSARKDKSPVELACSLGYFDIVEIFLENGCSPNLPTSSGKLLHSVLQSLMSHRDSIAVGRLIIKSLCSKGCDLNIKDYQGITPLMYCAQIGDSRIMEEVLSKCSELQLSYRCTGSQYTPLHMSVMRGDFECVKLLLSYSPHKHVHIQDKYCNTALILALKAMRQNIPYLNAVKKTLISLPSDEKNAQKLAAYENLMCFQHNQIAIIEALIMAGAVTTQDSILDQSLLIALHLCAEDETEGFEFEKEKFSTTIHLVSQQTMQNLWKWRQAVEEEEVPMKFTVYAGVVRLLVLAGAAIPAKSYLYMDQFRSVQYLMDELCEFSDKYYRERPFKLVHLAKQTIRLHLAGLQRLHEVSRLPLPPRLLDYVRLQCL